MSQRKRGAVWQYVVELGKGLDGQRRQVRRSGYRTKREAKDAEDRYRRDNPEGLSPSGDSLTVAQYLAQWMGWKQSLRPATVSSYETLIRRHIVPALGDMRLRDLKPIHLKAFYSGIESAATVRKVHGNVLHPALSEAVHLELIASSPAERVKPERKWEKAKRRFATEAEVMRVFAAADGTRYGTLVRLAVLTGMRRGELLGLKWEDIGEREITVDHQAVYVRRAGMTLSEPKTRAGTRRVSIGPDAVALLKKHRARQAEDRLREWADDYRDQGLVFADEFGQVEVDKVLWQAWIGIAKEAGVEWMHLHDLRHSYATLSLAAGVPLTVVSENLGHASIRVTADIYSHVLREVSEGAAVALELRLRGMK